MKFTAKDVELSIDQIANALFADPETNPDQPAVLMLSRDLSNPNSAYYVEVNDQAYGSYGGVKSARLSRKKLVVELEPKLAQKFGEPDFAVIEIVLHLDARQYAQVKDVLEKIFSAAGNVLSAE